MIESIMVFALGFLSSALLALLTLPAVNRRAERLARRRQETLLPLSAVELAAERDHLRAEFAVTAHRLEQQAERLVADKATALEESGRRAFKIAELEKEIATNLAAVEAAKKNVTEVEAALSVERDTRAVVERKLEVTLDKLHATEAALGLLSAAHTKTVDDLDQRRIRIAELETAAARLEAKLEETERNLTKHAAELVHERKKSEERELSIVEERAELLVMRNKLALAEQAHIEQSGRIETLEASESDLAKRLTEATLLLERRHGVIGERDAALAALGRKVTELEARRADDRPAEAMGALANLEAENAALRARIDEVADDIMRLGEEGTGQRGRTKRPA